MGTLMRRALAAALPFAALLAGCASDPVLGTPAGAPPLELGRRYTAWFHDGRTDELWKVFSPEMRRSVGKVDELRAFRAGVEREMGTETGVVGEIVVRWLGSSIYTRTSSFSLAAAPVWTQWVVTTEGMVAGFEVKPAEAPAASRFTDRSTRAPLRLPFQGEWFVFWGGRSVAENYHAATVGQRFAYDFAVVRDERTYAGDRSRNESYFCFGLPILAPADGRVVAARDGIDDNVPGRVSSAEPAGNHVVIDHGNDEFSFLAHLRKGSVAVRAGDEVLAGAPLGRCGNSGSSTEPHLHFHLQNSPALHEGEGLPAQFLGYWADGRAVDRGEPRRGELVRTR